jgi:hypothetical protein
MPEGTTKKKGAQVENLLTKAQKQIDEDRDDVKHMNQMMLYSKVVTIRDKQLEENKQLEQEWIEEQKRLDIMMEIERLKQCQEQEVREVRKKEAQKRGAQVIIDQIMERDQARIAEQELRDKERAQLLKNIDEMKKEDERQAKEKKERVKKLMEQVAASNKESLAQKELKVI